MSKKRKISPVLYGAAEYIRTHGWVQYMADSLDGSVCLGRAIEIVATEDLDCGGAWNFILDNMLNNQFQPHRQVTVTGFNDKHCAIAADAIAVLEIAGDLAYEEGM